MDLRDNLPDCEKPLHALFVHATAPRIFRDSHDLHFGSRGYNGLAVPWACRRIQIWSDLAYSGLSTRPVLEDKNCVTHYDAYPRGAAGMG